MRLATGVSTPDVWEIPRALSYRLFLEAQGKLYVGLRQVNPWNCFHYRTKRTKHQIATGASCSSAGYLWSGCNRRTRQRERRYAERSLARRRYPLVRFPSAATLSRFPLLSPVSRAKRLSARGRRHTSPYRGAAFPTRRWNRESRESTRIESAKFADIREIRGYENRTPRSLATAGQGSLHSCSTAGVANLRQPLSHPCSSNFQLPTSNFHLSSIIFLSLVTARTSHPDHHIALLVPLLDIAMRLDDLLQRIHPIDRWF